MVEWTESFIYAHLLPSVLDIQSFGPYSLTVKRTSCLDWQNYYSLIQMQWICPEHLPWTPHCLRRPDIGMIKSWELVSHLALVLDWFRTQEMKRNSLLDPISLPRVHGRIWLLLIPEFSEMTLYPYSKVLPSWSSGKESASQWTRHKRSRFDPCIGKIPWRRKWLPTPGFLPRKFHGWRSLVGLQSRGSQRVGYVWETSLYFFHVLTDYFLSSFMKDVFISSIFTCLLITEL